MVTSIAEDSTVQAAVYACLGKCADVELIFGACVTALQLPEPSPAHALGPALVTITPTAAPPSGETAPAPAGLGRAPRVVRARLVVGADGAGSAVRRMAGLGTWGWGYGQEAVVCTVRGRRVGDPPYIHTTCWPVFVCTAASPLVSPSHSPS